MDASSVNFIVNDLSTPIQTSHFQSILLPVLASLSLILCTPPLVWHIRNRNLAASALVFWVMLENVFNFINPILWPSDEMSQWPRGYVVCDIQGKLTIASNIGFPSSLLCIIRYLAIILDTKNTVFRAAKGYRSRQLMQEAALCIGLPMFISILHLVVQDTRYYIFAIAGCVPSYDDSWLSIALIHIWGPILNAIAAFYAVVVVVRLYKYKRDYSSIISASSSTLTKTRFIRLFAMSSILVVVALPLQLYGLIENISHYDFKPYSWSRVHAHWANIILLPTFGQVTIDHWVQVGVGFAVFIFFGFGKDAMNLYRAWLVALGLSRIWPALRNDANTHDSEKQDSITTLGSRAQLWVKKRLSWRGSMSSGHSGDSSPPLSPPPITSDSFVEKRSRFTPMTAIVELDPTPSRILAEPDTNTNETKSHWRQRPMTGLLSHITHIFHQARLPTFVMVTRPNPAVERTASTPTIQTASEDVFAIRVPSDGVPHRLTSSATSGKNVARDAAESAENIV